VWPAVTAWILAQERGSRKHKGLRRIDQPRPALAADSPATRSVDLGLFVDAGTTAARTIAGTLLGTLRSAGQLVGTARASLPVLARLGGLNEDSRISMSLLLRERALRHPHAPAVLYGDRAYTYAQADRRIDNVAAGLLAVGVRQGERVALLMETRPSAFVLTAALNRIGAVAVLLRPDGDPVRERAMSRARRVVVDPEHLSGAAALGAEILVLGGGGGDRDLGPGVIDLERINPAAVLLPAWYEADPGRARDEAFVLYAGEGDATKLLSITNRRWALSAFGTASAAALGEGDTLYTATPLHHSSTLLMTIGGAMAAGARLALSRGYEPDRFWAEVRRYGVTVASYTWTMLRDVADGPPDPAEPHHGLRLVIGSGMPPGLWERVAARLAPARVVEFYASAAGDAVLVNLDGAKPGSVGRPLPGAAKVRVVAWDLECDRLITGRDGLGSLTTPGEIGMLVSNAGPEARAGVLRNILDPGDAWALTGDLFRRDADGDLWRVGPLSQLVRTTSGPVSGVDAEAALQRLSQVDLAVAHSLDGDGAATLLALAVSLRPGGSLDAAAVQGALASVPEADRPALVHVVDEIPVTRSYRPIVSRFADRAGLGAVVFDQSSHQSSTALPV
jgi:putative long chain acyl-CoA synthase